VKAIGRQKYQQSRIHSGNFFSEMLSVACYWSWRMYQFKWSTAQTFNLWSSYPRWSV